MTRLPRPSRNRRPWSAATAGLTGVHNGFELMTGIGLVLQPELGLAGSGALWGVQLPVWLTLASRGGPRWDRVLAVWSGAALAGVTVHFVLWPLRRSRLGLPILVEAEGLDAPGLAFYNTLLYAWGTASVLSLALEIPRGRRRWAVVGLATLPLQLVSARRHFDWVRHEAEARPAWWNRAVAGS